MVETPTIKLVRSHRAIEVGNKQNKVYTITTNPNNGIQCEGTKQFNPRGSEKHTSMILSINPAIVQKRKSPHMLVWNEEAKQNWPKTKNKDTIRSPKEGEALKCSCEV